MMLTGGEHLADRRSQDQLKDFEGLVRTTARMFAAQVRREEDDLAQELRVKIWKALPRYDPARSPISLERYIFGVVTNKLKDYKRDAKREVDRRQRHGVSFVYIEDTYVNGDYNETPAERFDARYNRTEAETVYAAIEREDFTLPATVTALEADVLVLMMAGMSKVEIAMRLGVRRPEVDNGIAALRRKLADWRPDTGQLDNASQSVSSSVPTERVEETAQLAGSRAA